VLNVVEPATVSVAADERATGKTKSRSTAKAQLCRLSRLFAFIVKNPPQRFAIWFISTLSWRHDGEEREKTEHHEKRGIWYAEAQ
jgi:hypothetical protein